MPAPISLDQILTERQFSVKSTDKGDALVKSTVQKPSSWDDATRSGVFIMSTERVDRYGDVVVQKGGDFVDFTNNPVTLWAHASFMLPIGQWSDLKQVNGKPKRTEGRTTLAPEGTTAQADQIAKLIGAGMVRACSIGFIPKAWEPIKNEKDRIVGFSFVEWELIECSICSVPANPDAIVKAAGGDRSAANMAIAMALDEWSRTPEGLIVPRAEYERAYAITKDATVSVHEVRSIPEVEETPDAEVIEVTEAKTMSVAEKLVDAIITAVAKRFGVSATPKPVTNSTENEPETLVIPATEPVTAAAPATVPADEEFGETEAEFEARMAAEKAVEQAEIDDLAAEAEEIELRRLAEELVNG